MKKEFGWLIVLLIGIIQGCNYDQIDFKNVKEPTVKSLVGFPLGETKYTLRELIDEINDSSVQIIEDPNTTLLSIIFRDTIQYTSNNEFVSLPDVTIGDTANLPTQVPVLQPSTVQYNPGVQSFTFNAANGEVVEEVQYLSGNLTIEVFSNLTYPINFNMTLLNTQNAAGNAVAVSGSFSGGGPSTQTQSLAGYSILPDQPGGGTINQMQVSFTANVQLQTGESIPAGSTISYRITYGAQVIDIIYGYFGRDTIDLPVVATDVSFFQNLGSGSITFENPQLNLTTVNEIGVPIFLGFASMFGVSQNQSTGANDTTYLAGPITRSLQPVKSPTVSDGVGTSITDQSISVNGFNSTINQIFAKSPSQLVFDITAITNRDGYNSTNFYQNGLNFDTYIEILLPLSVQMTDIRREVTFDLPANFQVNFADSLSVRIATENLLPFSTVATIQFLDNVDTVVYETEEETVIATPFLDRNYQATEPRGNLADIPISVAGIDAINSGIVQKIRLSIVINTSQSLTSRNIYVDLLARYELIIKASLVAKLNGKL